MIALSDLGSIFGLFGIGVGGGVALLSLFFIFGSAVGFIFSIMARA